MKIQNSDLITLVSFYSVCRSIHYFPYTFEQTTHFAVPRWWIIIMTNKLIKHEFLILELFCWWINLILNSIHQFFKIHRTVGSEFNWIGFRIWISIFTSIFSVSSINIELNWILYNFSSTLFLKKAQGNFVQNEFSKRVKKGGEKYRKGSEYSCESAWRSDWKRALWQSTVHLNDIRFTLNLEYAPSYPQLQ